MRFFVLYIKFILYIEMRIFVEHKEEGKYIVPSLISAGKILKFLSGNSHNRSTLIEISKKLEINKSSCYRLLNTLTQMKMLSYDSDTRTYSLGSYLVVLGKRAEDFNDYIPVVKEYLKLAVQTTNSTCALVENFDDEWIYSEKEEPSSPIRVTINIGQRFKINSGATGKLFLAYMDYEKQQKYLSQLHFIPFTSQTIIERYEFEEELKTIRKQGYAISLEEHYAGIDGVSVPIFDRKGQVQMAITSIIVHSSHTKGEVHVIAERLKELSKELSEKIYF
jgi:IclR family KDG regulon transcriptional repressor